MVQVDNWTKFKLLLWKNWLLQWNHKTQLILELVIPAVFTLVLILLRQLVIPTKVKSPVYKPFLVTTLMGLQVFYNASSNPVPPIFPPPLMKLAYSPRNPYLEKIIARASTALKLGGDFKGVTNAEELEKELYANDYVAGVEFEDSLMFIDDYPVKLKFALRFPGDLRASNSKYRFSWQTSRLFPFVSGNYPRNYNFSSGGQPVSYFAEGFLAIQHHISVAYIDLVSNGNLGDDVELILQRFPYPDFLLDMLLEGLQNIVSLILMLSFIYPCTYITKYVTYEKEKQLKEVMKIMGIPNWIHWVAWFVKAFISLMGSSFIIIALITIRWSNDVAVLTFSNFWPVFFFFTVYVVNSIFFCFMLAVFFSRASTAAAVTGLVWFVTFIPFMLMIEEYNHLTYPQKLAWCLVSNTAMGFAMKIILGLEGNGVGLQWNNLFEPYNVDDELTVGTIMIMMAISSCLYMLICLYIEQVMPGEFGLPQKWYFPILRSFWCPKRRDSFEQDVIAARLSRKDTDLFEPDPKNLHAGLQIVNLKKKFGDKWAVKGLSLNMYQDEITVLLGHNGAGKTTTISMLTGMFAPTSGTAIINGYDILIDLGNARASLGICPQHNVLFDDMSVVNHIVFFCRLKGLKEYEIKNEIRKYLHLIDLEKKANVASRKLSGGMKRKLSVCCALCGGTKVVLLDEPSSGMDPSARRHMWNLIQGEKAGRTILITTHFMDEADVLGDRVAIMCGGELKCHGTPFFLKKKFGSGYRLICIKRDGCDIEKVTELLQKHIKGIQPDSDLGAELAYQLPYEYSGKFEELLQDLENNSEELKISGYGIAITTMEEVFLKAGSEKYDEERLERKYDLYRDEDAESLQSNISFGGTIGRTAKTRLLLNQWRAMFMKKILYTWRKKFLFFVQNFVPIFFVSMAVLISRGGLFDTLPPLPIDLREYPNGVVVIDDRIARFYSGLETAQIAKEYKAIVSSYGENYKVENTGDQSFDQYILELGKTKQTRINTKYLVAAQFELYVIVAYFNNQALHTAPLAINLIHNAMARVRLGRQYSIDVINKPLKQSTDTQIKNLQTGHGFGGNLASNVAFCMAFVTAMYILFLIQEKESKAKLLQFVSGVRVWIFWFTQFIWDMLTFTLTATVLVVTLGMYQEDYAAKFVELCDYFVLVMVFGLAALPLTYLLSSYFADPATGFARYSMINIFIGMALYVAIMVMSNPLFEIKHVADDLVWFFMLYPHFSLAMGMNELYSTLAINGMCGAEHIQKMPIEIRCRVIEECCDLPSSFSWKRPGIGAEIFYLICISLLCLTIVLLREYRFIRDFVINLKRSIKSRPIPPHEDNIDSDVAQEKNRISAMSRNEIASQNLVLDRVTKYYDQFLAVNQISLCVKPAECFGLLGVNGAGKTTTFKILTGDEKLSYGQAYVRGFSILTDMNTVYRAIGYCPQFDALLEDLTGREVLRIFCLLRGVPNNRIKYLSEELAKAFGFMKHMDKAVKNYSGGNKRKLSTAVAVLGNPSVVYLDEPTTGMDPGARRRLWNVVCMVRDTGKSIVLTSHSMEECEALCTRLAIMVNGEFKCIGSIQHLKNKFSKGFILKIKIKSMTPMMLAAAAAGNAMGAPENSQDSLTTANSSIDKMLRKVDSVDYYTPDAFTTDEEGEDGFKTTKIVPSSKQKTKTSFADNTKPTAASSSPESSTSVEGKEQPKTKQQLKNQKPKLPPAMSLRLQSQMRETYVQKVRDAIQQRFPLAVLQEYYQGMLTFYVPLTGVKWSQIFGFMEKNLEKLHIEDYAITQTTLEEIFLDFAKHQIDTRVHSRRKGCTACFKSK